MERSNFRFTLDLRGSSGGCQLDMKRGDTHRRLCITLSDGGCPYVITEDVFVALMAKTPDGCLLYTECTVENNEVICDLTSAYTATAGLDRCELRVYDISPTGEDGSKLLTSCSFVIRVHETVYNDDEELEVAGSVEATALTRLVTETYELRDEVAKTMYQLYEKQQHGEFDGVSATHRWEGTTLVVSSGSGTSSADLRGEKGEKGDKGDKGDPGKLGIDDSRAGEEAWSALHTVETLTAPFSSSGNVVTCNPVAGYPMEVSVQEAATVTRCGKNLFDPATKLYEGYVYMGSGATTNSSNYRYTDPIPAAHLVGKTITLNKCPAGLNPGMCIYAADGSHLVSGKGDAITVPEGASYLRFSLSKADAQAGNIQLELGSAATEYTPYTADTYNAADTCEIPGIPGENILFAYAENACVPVIVSGRADPVAETEKLKKQLEELTRRFEDV